MNAELKSQELRFSVQGMTCASCVAHVEKAIQSVEGVNLASVNLATEQAMAKVGLNLSTELVQTEILSAIKSAGYSALPITEGTTNNKTESLSTIPFVGSLTLTLPLAIHWYTPHWLMLFCATIVQFGFGARFYLASYKSLRNRAPTMDLLIALGTSAAYGLSLYNLFLEKGDLYFESSAMIITLVLLGKYLEALARRQTGSAIRALQNLHPATVRIKKKSDVTEIPLAELRKGDTMLVYPGERIAADGIISQGTSHLNESLISGESLPISKGPGAIVIGGSVNGEGTLHVRTSAVGSETVLGKMIRMVESAQMAKPPIQKLVDKIGALFVPVVLVLALLTFVGWILIGDHLWESALMHAVGVLVIACPCALGLATPTALFVGMGAAAREGILIKDAQALELAHKIRSVAFDKTGTLTEGEPKLTDSLAYDITEAQLLEGAAALQKQSSHPLAKAILKAAAAEHDPIDVENILVVPGMGIEGILKSKKLTPPEQYWGIGNERLLESHSIDKGAFEAQADQFYKEGKSIAWTFNVKTKKVLGIFAFSDPIKDSAKAGIEALKTLGIKTILISGDHEVAAKQVGEILQMDQIFAGVLPSKKSEILRELRGKAGGIAMVGDGMNDAPALAEADVGIAMSTGTDIAMEAAGVTLMRGDVRLVAAALEISKKTYGKIKQNLFWAFAYNSLGIPLAALGYLSPTLAGAAMALSSVSVVSNSLLLRRWKIKH